MPQASVTDKEVARDIVLALLSKDNQIAFQQDSPEETAIKLAESAGRMYQIILKAITGS